MVGLGGQVQGASVKKKIVRCEVPVEKIVVREVPVEIIRREALPWVLSEEKAAAWEPQVSPRFLRPAVLPFPQPGAPVLPTHLICPDRVLLLLSLSILAWRCFHQATPPPLQQPVQPKHPAPPST
jgi:hypothetical protein